MVFRPFFLNGEEAEELDGLLFGLIEAECGVEVADLIENGIGFGFGREDASKTGEMFGGIAEGDGDTGEGFGIWIGAAAVFVAIDGGALEVGFMSEISLRHIKSFAFGDHPFNPGKRIGVSHC